MSRSRVKVEGLRELDRALGDLKLSTARNVGRRTLKQALEPMAEAARQNVAKDRSGELRASIGVTSGRPKGRGYRRQDRIEAHMGPGQLPQAIQEEFGNRRQSPRPFMRPAWDAGKGLLLENVKTILSEEIAKAVQRAARKAARQAAKGGK
ncbi:HK97-gp10 family putative phage morphogenesis protein [Brevundimonas sp.]|uniref:HK97-gp10 family putative phage morphogenesis protein n=1 Tax=Brevundimonas sp. TaxID=1871086 RepID=UPI0035B27025